MRPRAKSAFLRAPIKVSCFGHVRAGGVVRGGPHPPSMVTVGWWGGITRVRTFSLKSDRLYWPKVLDPLDRLTRVEDQRLRSWPEQHRQAWTKATERNGPEERAYRLGYQGWRRRWRRAAPFHRRRPRVCLAVPGRGARGRDVHGLTERYKAAVARTSATQRLAGA